MRVSQTNANSVQSSDLSASKRADKSAAAENAKKNPKVGSTENPRATDGVKSEISARGKEFAQAKAVASQAPDIREDKVAELKARVAAGTYKVDGNAVADRMVDEHLKMSGIG